MFSRSGLKAAFDRWQECTWTLITSSVISTFAERSLLATQSQSSEGDL